MILIPIPVDLLLNELADAVAIGKTMVSVRQEAPAARVRKPRSRRVGGGRAHASAKAKPMGGEGPASVQVDTAQATVQVDNPQVAVATVEPKATSTESQPEPAKPEPAKPEPEAS